MDESDDSTGSAEEGEAPLPTHSIDDLLDAQPTLACLLQAIVPRVLTIELISDVRVTGEVIVVQSDMRFGTSWIYSPLMCDTFVLHDLIY
jgi:hypothetical protein